MFLQNLAVARDIEFLLHCGHQVYDERHSISMSRSARETLPFIIEEAVLAYVSP